MNDFAPVLICTLNRHVHFKRCVESLAACTYAEKTDLFIGLDYPLKDTHWEGYEIIKAYLPKIRGFRTVNIVERDRNYGVFENWLNMQKYVFQRYDRVIISEDDNVFAKSFLVYVNVGLCKFEKDPLVLAVCGYKFPFDIPSSYPYNYFYSKSFSGWGFGIWRNKDTAHNWNENSIQEINRYLHNPWKAFRLNSFQYGLINGLMNIVKSGKITGDRMYCFSNLLNGTYSVFPTVSKVRNTGHDGTGVHCTKIDYKNNRFVCQPIDTEPHFNYLSHSEYENKIVKNALKKHIMSYTSLRIHHKIKLFIEYIIFVFKY